MWKCQFLYHACSSSTSKATIQIIILSFSKLTLSDTVSTCLQSQFLSAYRKSYGTQHVLIRLIEEFKKYLDNDYVVGAILMDLSKAFDCVPHDLLLAKLSAYGFSNEALSYVMTYLTDRKQSTRLNNFYSTFQLILSGVPQGSILGPILFNIFFNDFLYFIKTANVHNYADDNTLSSSSNSISNLIRVLETESDVAMSWLKVNRMIANPKKISLNNLIKRYNRK